MSNHYFDDQDYNGENYQKSPLLKGDYDNCTFTKCNFKESDLKNINFSECTFTDCDFSMADIGNCSFKEVEFYECKLLGLQFESCNPFLMSLFFKGCTLNFSSFYKLKLSGMKFIRCTLEQVDFTEANLTSVSFENFCYLLDIADKEKIILFKWIRFISQANISLLSWTSPADQHHLFLLGHL